jgi:hypothetical protein
MEQILQTDGAVGVELFGLAPMVCRGNARAARVAVHQIRCALYAANAALVAVVVIPLHPIVKEVAHGAKVGGKLDAALNARVGHGLPFITFGADHFFDRMPVHFMALGVIVAVTAHIRLVAARGNQAATAHVVFATNTINTINLFIGLFLFFLFIFFFLLFFGHVFFGHVFIFI